MDIFAGTILGNAVQSWLVALLIFVLVYLSYGIIKHYLLRRLTNFEEAKKGDADLKLIRDLFKGTKSYLVFFLALYLSSLALSLPELITEYLRTITIVVLILQAGLWCVAVVDYFVQRRIKEDPENEAVSATTMGAVSLMAKIALWAIVALLILQNVTGMELDALIATLGVGGIAVALAVQNILSDLFSSVSIALDKPFVIGDSIAVDEFSGTVEAIGLKSTRLRSISGEQLIFSNSDLLGSRIQNFQRLDRRRLEFSLGVVYQTPYEKIAAIPGMIREIVESFEDVTFDRAHFKGFGNYALTFDYVYYMDVTELKIYLDTQQAINLAICQRFEKEGIKFAYPTQTVFVAQ